MDFTLEAIQVAHQQYSGSDFPKLVAVFKAMGMESNTVNLLEGVIVYRHKNGETLIVHQTPIAVDIPEQADISKAILDLKRHQRGETDFPTFSLAMAEDGIVEWTTRMDERTCSYYDRKHEAVIVEAIAVIELKSFMN